MLTGDQIRGSTRYRFRPLRGGADSLIFRDPCLCTRRFIRRYNTCNTNMGIHCLILETVPFSIVSTNLPILRACLVYYE